MTRPPTIGVTTSITTDKPPERAYVNSAYLAAVQQAGGVPLLLPPQLSAASLDALAGSLDGLLLTGGGDLDPALFGEAPHPTVADVSPARDALELAVLARALARGLPVLAICRGAQILNVALGGSLHQDVASAPGAGLQHAQQRDGTPREQPTHAVRVAAGSRLAAVLGAEALEVNSMHHQAVKRPGRGLRAVAWAPDGLVEAVETEDRGRFVLGVQWHPEELVGHSEAARRLFRAHVEAAASLR